LNQQWDLLYADEWKGDPKKGELNKEYGMYVERDFYISTAMNSHRYLDLSTTGTLSLRLQMEETPRNGTSIKSP
jgi:hypothetical protein